MRPKKLMNLYRLSPKMAVEGLKTQTVSNIMKNTFKDSWVKPEKKSKNMKSPKSIDNEGSQSSRVNLDHEIMEKKKDLRSYKLPFSQKVSKSIQLGLQERLKL